MEPKQITEINLTPEEVREMLSVPAKQKFIEGLRKDGWTDEEIAEAMARF